MLHHLVIRLLVFSFLGAGLFNAIGSSATQDDFARWGYPRWWCWMTGGLEIACAAPIAFPAGRGIGLALGSIIIAAALVTELRRRELKYASPLGLFAVLLALVALTR